MTSDELLDLVNKKDEIIGEVWKSEAHSDPSKIHREVAIVIFDSSGEVLLQKRSSQKEVRPGVWAISAAGHIEKGEDPLIAIKRETYEELGFEVDPVFHSKLFDVYLNRESRIFWIYYAIMEEKPIIKIDKDEVIDVRWVHPEKLINFSKKHKWDVNSKSHKYIMKMYENLFVSK